MLYFRSMGFRYTLPLLTLLIAVVSGCDKEIEPIPAYIKIDSVSVSTTAAQGNPIHEISAVNVYVDEQFMGLFEIPCTIPVLFSGKHKLSIIPSVRLNGALNQHVIHRLFNRTDTTINLVEGKITETGNINLTYKSNTEFAWLEDFEDNNSSLIRWFSSAGDTSYITTEPFSLNGRYVGNTRCMKVVIGAADTAKTVDMASFKYFGSLPLMGTDIMFEFDIKTPVPVQMAMIRKNSSGKLYLPYVYIFETGGEWKRFYINLIYELYNQPGDTEIQLMLSPIKAAEIKASQEIFIDNIRFSYPK